MSSRLGKGQFSVSRYMSQIRWMIGTGMMTWKRPLAAPTLIQGSSLKPAASTTPRKELRSMVQSNMPQQKMAPYLFDSEKNMLSRLMKRGYSEGPIESRISII